MTKRPWQPAPPDPPFKLNGIRARALEGVLRRGPRPPETPEELRRAQAFWAKFRAEQAQRVDPEEEDAA